MIPILQQLITKASESAMLWPKVTCWREWPPDSDSLGVSLIVNRTYITKRMPQTLYKWMALELATFWLNSHDEEDDPQTPAVDGLGVGPASCSHQNFRGQVSGRAAKCLHHGARVHKLGQAKVCHLQPTQMKQNPSEVNIMDNPRSFSCNQHKQEKDLSKVNTKDKPKSVTCNQRKQDKTCQR